MTDLAIVIVSWNVRDLLAACLHSIQADLAHSSLSAEIWVVDNASTDGSVEMLRRDFPEVQLIAAQENLGFAGGNNAALRAMGFQNMGRQTVNSNSLQRGENAPTSFSVEGIEGGRPLPKAVLLLNPDTEVHPGALHALTDFLQQTPQAGIAGANLIYGDGTFQHGAFAFPGLWQLAIELLPLPGRLVESTLNGRYPRHLYQNRRPFEIGHPLGAAMCVKREAIEQAGLLDQRYHMYVEEIDWSKRIVSAGWRAYCVPAAVITHYGGQSTGQIQTNSFINLWTSRHRFYSTYYSPSKLWLAQQIVKIGMKRNARRDAEAVQQGKLTQTQLAERLSGYRQVITIWERSSA